ncbi:MAG: vault protein inter-alpha-trypsin protein [Bryobacterales bacterium]|nr:vault protein inter-alpha-trypsin protein [Bryobacterales bacterium]
MKRFSFGLICWLAVTVCLVLPAFARADGFIIVHDGPQVPGHFSFAPLEVSYHHVTVDINDQVAVTSVDQEFYNPNQRQLEGTYIFPLPEGSHIDKFSMDINGKMMDAELLPADKARAMYEEIVRKAKDPALLEYIGRDAFKVRIFPIEPNARKHVKITYTQLLKSDSGLTEFVYPLNTEKFSSRPLKDVSIKINLNCQHALKAVYCPSHNCDIRRDGDQKAVIGYEQHNVRPDTDFKLIFSEDPKEIGINLLTYRNGADDGYFLLMASPGNTVKADSVQPKDITFVLDTSGSMAGAKMEQARKALTFCLANLNETDRFEIIRFSTETEPLFDALVPANKQNVDKAMAFVKNLKAIGATAIDEAMKKSLSYQHDPNRPYQIIFLTDGLPTIGETREENIVGNIQKVGQNIRIFPFGIGNDVNTHLLDRIADGTKAFSQYVLPEEDLEVKLSNFYTKIKEPVLSNVHLTFGGNGIKPSEVYPNSMPDLFKGQMLFAFGRYSGFGNGSVKITGTLNGQQKEFAADVKFTESDTKNAFIPRLWATRRVGWLLDEIRLHGESRELKDEVVRLSREHGIVTPYTAFLILEDEQKRGVPLAAQNFREFGGDANAAGRAKSFYDSAKGEARDERMRAGAQAVTNASSLDSLKRGDNLSQASQGEALAKNDGFAGGGRQPFASLGAAPATQPSGYRYAQNYSQQVRVVNGRAFYQNGEAWTDSTIQSKKDAKTVEIKFNSDEYFGLIKKYPYIAQWMSLGSNVDVLIEDTVYCVK